MLRRCTSPESAGIACRSAGSSMSSMGAQARRDRKGMQCAFCRSQAKPVLGRHCPERQWVPNPLCRVGIRLSTPMNDPKAPRPSRRPLMDALGQMCADGKDTAEFLWQVPKDPAARQKIMDLLIQIGIESLKQGRREMPKLVEELKTAAQASPSPQQVEMLVDGFDRLTKLWQAAKSGLL